jgi:BTB/POZ domain-containing protein KCTD9
LTTFVTWNSVLRDADLRRSTFKACDFSGADLQGAKFTRKGAAQLQLSPEQARVIAWQDSEGPEPPGG